MFLDPLLDVIILLAILLVLVVLHEAGHFVAARLADVKVHEFGIGFPPRAMVLRRGGETLYTLNWLPIGGFVRLEGEEGESVDRRAFVNQSMRKRLAILLAGVAVNLLIAWLLFSLIAGLADPTLAVRVGRVLPDSPAQAAGLVGGRQTGTDAKGDPVFDRSGEVIVAIDGQRFPFFDSIETLGTMTPQSAYLLAHAGQAVVLTVRGSDGAEREVPVTLRVPSDPREGALGVTFVELPLGGDLQRGPLEALAIGLRRTLDASTLILRGVGELITNLGDPQVAGPVGIVGAVGALRADYPPAFLFWLAALLSANLAVINALPFPPLDGGRVAMAIARRFAGGRLTPAVERRVYLTGFMLLMLLLAWVTLFDVRRLGAQ